MIAVGFFWCSYAIALTPDERTHEDELTRIATDRCSSEQVEGKNYYITVRGDGRLEVHFIGKKGGKIKGSFIYTKAQWDGRQRVLQEHQALDNINRRQCIREELKLLRDSYVPPHSESINTKMPLDFSTDKDGFLIKKNGSRVCEEKIDEQELEMYKAEMAAYGNKQPSYRKLGDDVIPNTEIEPVRPIARIKCKFYDGSWVSQESE